MQKLTDVDTIARHFRVVGGRTFGFHADLKTTNIYEHVLDEPLLRRR